MNWAEIIIAFLGSSVVATVVSALINKPKSDAETKKIHSEINETYADRLERRIDTVTERLEVYELREIVEESAINCAHKCHIPDAECPVLIYMKEHPMPRKSSYARKSIEDKEL